MWMLIGWSQSTQNSPKEVLMMESNQIKLFFLLNIIILLIIWEFHIMQPDHTHLVHGLVEVSLNEDSLMWLSLSFLKEMAFTIVCKQVPLSRKFMKALFLKRRMTSDPPPLLCSYFIDIIPNLWRYVTSDLLLGSKPTLQDSKTVELSHIFCPPPSFSIPIFLTALSDF